MRQITPVLLALSLGICADKVSYSLSHFADNKKNTVVTSSLSVIKDIWNETQILLDFQWDQIKVPPIDGATGATSTYVNSNDFLNEHRIQLIFGLQHQLLPNIASSLSYYNSQENDYASQAVATEFKFSLAQDNTQIGVKGQYTYDEVGKVLAEGRQLNTPRETYGVNLSINQLLSPTTKGSLVLDHQYIKGKLSDPYRQITFADGRKSYEKVPNLRKRYALTPMLKEFFPKLDMAVLLKYRYYFDLWGDAELFGVESNLGEVKINKGIGKDWVLSLQYRMYQQKNRSFYKSAYTGKEDYYTNDYKLANFSSKTYGAGLSYKLVELKSLISFLEFGTVDFDWFHYENDMDFKGNVFEGGITFSF